MTSKQTPRVCDFCATDIMSEMKYTLQLSQRGGIKGKFVKCDNNADMCHDCFLKICKNGFKPKWVTLVKGQDGKWAVLDEQTKLNE